MVMIRCPQCGQRALDVASVCPKCGHVLIQNPLETHEWGALRECGRCGKHIERDVAVCPYCGHHVRAVRMAWRTALGAVGVVALVGLGVALWRAGVFTSLRSASEPGRPAAASPAPARGDTAPVPAPPVDTVTASPIVASQPQAARPDTTAPAPTAARVTVQRSPARAAGPAGPRPQDLVTRWTLEWANVRAARSVEATVVRVIPPGRAVEVREMQRGWWALHAGGAVVGYIANSVLSTTPPG